MANRQQAKQKPAKIDSIISGSIKRKIKEEVVEENIQDEDIHTQVSSFLNGNGLKGEGSCLVRFSNQGGGANSHKILKFFEYFSWFLSNFQK